LDGRYQVTGVLGSGGMGVVYEAKHLGLGTIVAIKVLRSELVESDEQVARFQNEGRCMAALSGDHVVRVFDAGWLETGLPFLAMERLDGRDLGALVRDCGRLAVSIAVDYALDACAGLAEAHAFGLIHCDVKPSNLFLTTCGVGAPRIKLIDFGIARWIGAAAGGAELLGEELLLGSPSYCSPEQLEDPDSLDERTDIWSLGVVLFEMLTGTSPYSLPTLAEIRTRILSLSRPTVRALRPELDARLASVVERCLEKDRSRRFRSVQELGAALRPFASAPTHYPAG
jgi:serine/threonine protein kinase